MKTKTKVAPHLALKTCVHRCQRKRGNFKLIEFCVDFCTYMNRPFSNDGEMIYFPEKQFMSRH